MKKHFKLLKSLQWLLKSYFKMHINIVNSLNIGINKYKAKYKVQKKKSNNIRKNKTNKIIILVNPTKVVLPHYKK